MGTPRDGSSHGFSLGWTRRSREVRHATAGVVLIETGSGSESDLEDALDRSGYVRRGLTDRVRRGSANQAMWRESASVKGGVDCSGRRGCHLGESR
jgi:hypothetical protein